jgi:hypothetical protein
LPHAPQPEYLRAHKAKKAAKKHGTPFAIVRIEANLSPLDVGKPAMLQIMKGKT